MDDVLVVGYGSDLRGDDAAGRRAVEAVAARGLAGVRVLSLPQLAPEIAEDLTQCRLAIFVDASTTDTRVVVRDVEPGTPDWRLSHSADPASLLALAGAMGEAPRAVLVSVPARDFALGAPLSPETAEHVVEAARRTTDLCATFTEGG